MTKMTATVARKLAEVTAAGAGGLLVKNGMTAGLFTLRNAGLVTIECIDPNRGPQSCGWYLVKLI